MLCSEALCVCESFKYVRYYLIILFIKFSCGQCIFTVSCISLLEIIKYPDMPKSKTESMLSFFKKNHTISLFLLCSPRLLFCMSKLVLCEASETLVDVLCDSSIVTAMYGQI